MSMTPSNHRLRFFLGVALLATAVVGVAALPNWVTLLDKAKATNVELCQRMATAEQAEALLRVQFPEMEINSTAALDFGSGPAAAGCLLEVDLTTVRGDAAKRGFVYILPDGLRFLNGPVLDRRSKVGALAAQPRDAAVTEALRESKLAMEKLNSRLSHPADSSLPNSASAGQLTPPAAPARSSNAKEKREELLGSLSALPNKVISAGGDAAKSVYVLFDPTCVNCARLAKQSEQLTASHGIKWNWLPIYTSEPGWVLAAFARRAYKDSPQMGDQVLREMVQPEWDQAAHKEQFDALTEQDFEDVKDNFKLYHQLASSNAGLGTPVVVYRRADGEVEVISGVPSEEDWQSLPK